MNTLMTTRKRGSEFDELFTDLLDGFAMPAVNSAGPRYRWTEGEDDFTLAMEVPGFDKKELSVERDGNQLFVSATRDEKEIKNDPFKRTGFNRVFRLPKDLDDSSKVEAKLDNGVLELKLAKLKKKPSRTTIKIS